mgnify:CR=1 FL=1
MNKLLDQIEAYLQYIENVYGEDIYLDKKEKIEESSSFSGLFDEQKPKQSPKKELTQVSYPLPSEQKEVAFLVNESGHLFASGPAWKSSTNLTELFESIRNCTNCQLGLTRNKFVFGAGNPKADIMIIGEAPGADEDAQGEPFVGRAGQLLTKILAAINLSRDDVYICNILKCRPPDNRRPEPEEITQCEPFLLKQIELIKPEFILALGLTAVDSLLKKKHKMADTRGKIVDYHGIKMLVTYHPAALLRNPNLKKPLWDDVQLLRELYNQYLENTK